MHQYQFSLVFFTVLTQWSIGTLLALTVYQWVSDKQPLSQYAKSIALFIWGICVIGSLSSLKHLGNPLQAYYALRGLSHSWMSREVVIFGLLNGLMTLWVLTHLIESKPYLQKALAVATTVTGLIAMTVAGQIYYRVEHQPEWNTLLTHLGFLGTALLLGSASLIAILARLKQPVPPVLRFMLGSSILLVFTVIVLLSQITGTSHLLWFRVFASILTGVALCVLAGSVHKYPVAWFAMAALLMVTGEIAGRMFFFSSVMSKVVW